LNDVHNAKVTISNEYYENGYAVKDYSVNYILNLRTKYLYNYNEDNSIYMYDDETILIRIGADNIDEILDALKPAIKCGTNISKIDLLKVIVELKNK
jgi:hypothetical protein